MADRIQRVLVTGGSGFIGTHCVEHLRASGYEVSSIDRAEPMNARHRDCFTAVDVLDRAALERAFQVEEPDAVIHLAARSDLGGGDYRVNTEGLTHLAEAARAAGVSRVIFTSTRLVCPLDVTPSGDQDWQPNTEYGASKAEGERRVRELQLPYTWCIVRPTSIWGPWSMAPHIPYGRFFVMVARGRYLHPAQVRTARDFGFVGNVAARIEKLLNVEAADVHGRVFYLSDDEPISVRTFADTISRHAGRGRVRLLPAALAGVAANVGSLVSRLGFGEAPLTRRRLRNMATRAALVDVESTRRVLGPAPFALDEGVELTLAWLRQHGELPPTHR